LQWYFNRLMEDVHWNRWMLTFGNLWGNFYW
jgi:hypothetical protein